MNMNTLEYNTKRTKLIIPEYGRHIHQMIDQAVAQKDKEERNKMAKAIIGVMGNLNPHLRDVPDFQHKLWAQLFIMSNFELDVDSPFENPVDGDRLTAPNRIDYPNAQSRAGHFGRTLGAMVDMAKKMDDGEEKTILITKLANTMKMHFLTWKKR